MDSLILKLTHQIANEIISFQFSGQDNNGLLSGKLGEAIFLYEYSQYYPQYSKSANQILDQVYESIQNGNIYHSYCAGLAGICIGLYYLQERNFIDSSDFISEEIDYYLEKKLEECIISNYYDFLHGATGLGFYFIERAKRGSVRAMEMLNLLVTYFDNHAIIENNLIKWAKIKADDISFDISLSHGISAIAIFLCRILSLKDIDNYVDTEKIKWLIRGSVNYILCQEIDVEKYKSYFPYTFKDMSKEMSGSRLAWCYGDLGISIALLEAADILNNKEYFNKAMEILDYSCSRKDLYENWVFDAGLCHGTSGIALIFYNLYIKTRNHKYLNTAKYWIDKTLEYCNPAKEINTFKINYDMKQGVWNKNLNILEGLAGIGLTLLSFYFKEKPYWSKLLLLL